MIESLISPKTKENILLYLAGRNEGYAREIAKYYDCSLSPVQNQMENLEIAGVIVSKQVGKTVVYQLNPRYAFKKELLSLLEKAISFLPESERERLLINRRRPRRRKKPL